MHFSTTAEVELLIWNGTGENWIYWAIEKKSLNPEQLNRVNSIMTLDSNLFQISESQYWKYFNLNDDENIFFPDFSYKGTFDLINDGHRKMMIETKLVPEICSFLQEIS